MADTSKLHEIREVLLQARNAPDYNIGSPRALDHLLVHLVAVIDAIAGEKPPARLGTSFPGNETFDDEPGRA